MKLCLGTVQLGMDYGVQGGHQPAYSKADEILSLAEKSGIHTFDCAAAYGEAESVLGHYVGHNREKTGQIRVISKLAAGVFRDQPSGDWADLAIRQAKASRERLHVQQLEAYLFHDASMIQAPAAVTALREVQRAGVAKKIGVSVYSPEEAMKALDYTEIEVIQIPYNVFDHRLDRCDFFERAGERGVQVYARSVLLQGLLTMDTDRFPEKMSFAKSVVGRYHDICAGYGITPLRAAINYVVKHPGIDCLVFGVDSPEQLNEFVDAVSAGIPEELKEELTAAFWVEEEKLVNPVLWK
ncbi:MAG: aldo/keto reductase [Lachnospiraceae bacterium]|nr:aldo/keto reductase [Lachnospiraceae bacterium]